MLHVTLDTKYLRILCHLLLPYRLARALARLFWDIQFPSQVVWSFYNCQGGKGAVHVQLSKLSYQVHRLPKMCLNLFIKYVDVCNGV